MRDLANGHKLLERLALTSYPSGNVLANLSQFTKLKSLSLCLAKEKEAETVESGTEEPDQESGLVSVGVALDSLPIQSLELSGEFLRRQLRGAGPAGISLPRAESEIPSLSTTPQLIRKLKHLHIRYMINVECVEYFLRHCRCLEALRLDDVLCWGDGEEETEYPPLIHSSEQISPFLQVVALAFRETGFDPDDTVRAC